MRDDGIILPKRSVETHREESPDPNPGLTVARFIAWLKKRGYVQSYKKCEIKCHQLGLDIEDDVLDYLGEDFIRVHISRGVKVVTLANKTWAHDISHYHGVDIPHHKHHKPW